ncbi:phosphatase PAP2 family protein [Pseudalkalibacillus sp. SCS-8]|uniref:phosphatase PAP2 family protein n=1 Tax=Pseudalkalibacillus nanhaiensis TaxID=3115291 RepID=UPI0032DBB008
MSKLETQTKEMIMKKVSLKLVLGLIVTLGLIGLFAQLADGVLENELEAFDHVLSTMVHSLQAPWLTEVMIFITHIGNTMTYVVVVSLYLVVLLVKRLKLESFILLLTILGAWGLNGLLKISFQRARPSIEHLIEVGGYSFPSGHAMVSCAAYGIMAYLIAYYLGRRNKPYWYIAALASILIFLIGVSRIYLHVHYPSDVIAGFAAGGAWLLTCIFTMKTLKRRGEKRSVSAEM